MKWYREPTSGQHGPKQQQKQRKYRQNTEKEQPASKFRQDDDRDEAPGPESKATEKTPTDGNAPKPKHGTEKTQAKADKAGAKLDTAKEKLAAQKPPKPPGLVKKAVHCAGSATWLYTHNKIHQVEHENVGVEGAHKTELVAEAGAKKLTRYAKRRIRERPARVAEKWEKKSVGANAKLHYQKMVQEHPEVTSNPVSRFIQKQRIKRDYQKKARKAAKQGAKKTDSVAGKLVRAVGGAVKRHPLMALMILLLFGVFLTISSAFSALPILGNGVLNIVSGTSYTSEDADLVAVERQYAAMEAELQGRIDNIEQDNARFDEYKYQGDSIAHNPHALASYLTALYKTYDLSMVREELQRTFEQQYILTLTESTETRYRTETQTDPETGESVEVQVPYEYRILNVSLKNTSISALAADLLNTEQLEMFRVYLETSGNKPLIFGGGSTNGNPSEDLGGVHFVNGTRPGNLQVIDIAKSQVGNVGGYPYWSWYGFDSRVEWCACFVSWCYNQVGKSEPRFAGCTSGGMAWFQGRGQWGDRNYPNIAPGDSIFFDWDYTGDADHVGLVVGTDGVNVYTVEGNSNDACRIRSYPLGSEVIRGYGLMNWD